jgi:mitochondrial-processing peptidase subunit alpha
MISTMRLAARNPSASRSFAAASTSPPLLWKLAHGAFDAETPMATPLPGIPIPSEAPVPTPGDVSLTTLSNGVRVASQDNGGSVSAMGVFVGAGSRHETPHTAGATHLLEHLAYKGSHARSKYRMTRDIERSGASFAAAASRETLAYTAEVRRAGDVADVVAIMAESATSPAVAIADTKSLDLDFAQTEINSQVAVLKSELAAFSADPAGKVSEAVHAAAFHGNTLGKLTMRAPSNLFNFLVLLQSPVRNETRECAVAAFASTFNVVVSAPP